MGRVLLEAGYSGRARIGAAVGGIPYYVRDGVDGLLFAPEDVEGLEASLRRLMSDANLVKLLGQKAAEGVESTYSLQGYLETMTGMVGSD
jgi:glycosyltransferase involved in cell wall biosynthesis